MLLSADVKFTVSEDATFDAAVNWLTFAPMMPRW